jgi:plasmid stability protein
MSQLLVRDVDEKVVAAIRARARGRGVSMQKELQSILNRASAWAAADAEPAVYPPVRAVRTAGKPASRVLIGERR